MGKRSSFERNPRDFYPTPWLAFEPLVRHISHTATHWDPCAGDGALIDHLRHMGLKCRGGSDIEPQKKGIIRQDAMTLGRVADFFITNPPWDRKILHPLIDHLRKIAPTWLLIDADWMHTKQAEPYLWYCHSIISVGRVKWIPDSKMTGKDNCAWYLFNSWTKLTAFHGRRA